MTASAIEMEQRSTMISPDEMGRQLTTERLVDAITENRFVLYGQLIVPLGARRESFGYIEVLIRYIEEETNLLAPGGFFEVLESLNLMPVLDRWVLNRVVHSMVEQHNAQSDWNVPRYSVNLSTDSLYVDEFPTLVGEYFGRYRLPPDKLGFELDESDAQAHTVALVKLTSKLRGIGCGFALTSYTGDLIPPASLPALGVDAVKMDGKIIAGANLEVAAPAGGKATHLVCKDLGIRTIAQMVEDQKTLEKLKQVGVDYAQGYAIARPAPLQSLIK
jgi:EAL domain-containing protein (putative c-di-GMP-specific phosphodiesterase class I)